MSCDLGSASVESASHASELIETEDYSEEDYHEQLRMAEILDAEKDDITPLQKFYKKQRIFMTGGTGFLGKFLIRKLFQICPDIECIYVLIRPKGKTLIQRKNELVFDPILEDVRLKYPEIVEKIIPLTGDLTHLNIGLSFPNKKLLIEKATIVFHLAGGAFPNASLSTALDANYLTTIAVARICQKMKNLMSFIYVSNAYCFNADTDKDSYFEFQKVLDFVYRCIEKKEEVSPAVLRVLDAHGNNYTLSKKITEQWIQCEIGSELPVGIFKTGLLLPSIREPRPGQCLNNSGLIRIIKNVMKGFLRVMRGDSDKKANIVPVDMAANALLSCAHDVALFSEEKNSFNKRAFIYNYVSTEDAPITWDMFRKYLIKYINEYPYVNSIWYGILYFFKYQIIYNIYVKIYHKLSAHVLNFMCFMEFDSTNHQHIINDVEKFAEHFVAFTMNEWKYDTARVRKIWDDSLPREKEICNFDLKGLNWEEYIADCVKGVRLHVLKDPESSLQKSKNRSEIYYRASNILAAIFYSFLSMSALSVLVIGWIIIYLTNLM